MRLSPRAVAQDNSQQVRTISLLKETPIETKVCLYYIQKVYITKIFLRSLIYFVKFLVFDNTLYKKVFPSGRRLFVL